jgi:hypothetical protein
MGIAASTSILASLGLVLAASDAGPESQAARPLPDSSIAAVLAARGELGLSADQVKELEGRDAALQRQRAAIRELQGAPPAPAKGSQRGPPGADGASRGTPPDAIPGDRSAGAGARGGAGVGGGGRKPSKTPGAGTTGDAQDPATRAAALQRQLDDADTRAWLEAEARLPPEMQERARAIAARYREALGSQREKGGGR